MSRQPPGIFKTEMIENLCDELIINVVIELRDAATRAFACCSRRFYVLVTSPAFWKCKLRHLVGDFPSSITDSRWATRKLLRAGHPHLISRLTGLPVQLNRHLAERTDVVTMDSIGQDIVVIVTAANQCLIYSSEEEHPILLSSSALDVMLGEGYSNLVIVMLTTDPSVIDITYMNRLFHRGNSILVQVNRPCRLAFILPNPDDAIVAVVTDDDCLRMYTVSLLGPIGQMVREGRPIKKIVNVYVSIDDGGDGVAITVPRRKKQRRTKIVMVGKVKVSIAPKDKVERKSIHLSEKKVRDICEYRGHVWAVFRDGTLRTTVVEKGCQLNWLTVDRDVVSMTAGRTRPYLPYITEL